MSISDAIVQPPTDDRILTIHDCTGGEENILDMHVYTCGALLLIFYCFELQFVLSLNKS